MNARRTEKLTGRDDRVECVRVEPMLGDKRDFWGCVEREVAGAAKDGLRRAGVSGLNKRMGREISLVRGGYLLEVEK